MVPICYRRNLPTGERSLLVSRRRTSLCEDSPRSGVLPLAGNSSLRDVSPLRGNSPRSGVRLPETGRLLDRAVETPLVERRSSLRDVSPLVERRSSLRDVSSLWEHVFLRRRFRPSETEECACAAGCSRQRAAELLILAGSNFFSPNSSPRDGSPKASSHFSSSEEKGERLSPLRRRGCFHLW